MAITPVPFNMPKPGSTPLLPTGPALAGPGGTGGNGGGGSIGLGGTAGTVVDPITAAAVTAAANQTVKTNSAPWGNPIPLSMGSRAVGGKITWSSDLRQVPPSEPPQEGQEATPQYVVDFAVDFGKSGLPAAQRNGTILNQMWIQQALVFSNDDETLSDTFSGMTITFHPGLVDAIPDALISADKKELTPAWRNHLYAVVQNFPLWKIGLQDGLPDQIVGEIFDVATIEPTITNYDMTTVPHPGGAGDGLINQSPLVWDPTKGYAYAVIKSGTDYQIGAYDPSDLTEASRVTIAGQGTTYSALSPDALCIHDLTSDTILVTDVIGNSTPLHLIKLGSGQIIQSIGKASTNILTDIGNVLPAQCEITYKTSGDIMKAAVSGMTVAGYVLGGIWDQVCTISIQSWRSFSAQPPTGLRFSEAINLGGDIGLLGTDNIQDLLCYPIIGRTDLKRSASASMPTTPGLAGPGGTGGTSTGGATIASSQPQDGFVFVARGPWVTMLRYRPKWAAGSVNGTADINFNMKEQVDVATFAGGNVVALYVDPKDFNLVVFWTPLDNTGVVMNVAKFKITCSDSLYSDQGWRPVVEDMVYNVQLPAYYFANELRFCPRNSILNGVFGYLTGDDTFVEFDLGTGNVLRTTEDINLSPTGGIFFRSARGSFEYIDNTSGFVKHVQLRTTNAEKVLLSDILASWMLDAGYTTDQYDIDPLITDMTYGSMIDSTVSVWEVIKNVAAAYDFSYFTSGSKVKFVKATRLDEDADFVATLSNMAYNDGNPYEAITTIFASSIELPGNTGITYIDNDQNYVANTQTFRRNNFPVRVTNSTSDSTISLPIVMKAEEALRRSAICTYNTSERREAQSLRLPIAYATVEPADVIQAVTANYTYNILVTEVVLDTDWTVAVTGSNRSVRPSSSFRLDANGDWIDPGTAPFVVPVSHPPTVTPSTSQSVGYAFDTTLIDPDDDQSLVFDVVYAGGGSINRTGWVGATISTQVGSDAWNNLFHSSKSLALGTPVNVLPDTDTPFQTDHDTTFKVECKNFVPSVLGSVTTGEMLDGENAILVGAPGRWELVYYRDVSVVGQVATLTELVRGCRGTELHVGDHDSSDMAIFVTIQGTRMGYLGQAVLPSREGEAFSVRARGDGIFTAIQTNQVEIEGNSLRPWAPCAERIILGSEVNAVAATDYFNECGGGDNLTQTDSRVELIAVTANYGTTSSPSTFENLVNGNVSNGTTGSADFINGKTDYVLTFDFRPSGFKQIIDAIKWEQSTSASQGTWDIEASDDGVMWTSLASGIDLTNSSSVNETTFVNADSYWYYRLKQVTGTTSSGPWLHEIYFNTMADVGADDLVIRWQRRDRLGQEFVEEEQPLSEDHEEYELEILLDGGIVRTIEDLTTPLYVYTSANQTTDGFTPPLTELEVNIYQISENVGRGFADSKTVTVGVP